MTDSPGGIDQVKLPRAVPGLGDNLLTVARPEPWLARVRCKICAEEQDCRVVPGIRGAAPDTMDGFSFHFWLWHLTYVHPGVLPVDVEADL